MVNVKNLFGMAVVATALVGCSSNDNLNPNTNEGAGKIGTAYASFKINLPTTNGTRAGEPGTPTFDEGTPAEYEVKNGTILIFDNDGKFVESAELGTMNPWTKDTDANGVTTAAAVTVQLSKVTVGGSYQALVLLNNNVDATTKKVTLPNEGDSYYTWSANAGNANASKYESTSDGIFMANAPEYKSTTENPSTLVAFNNVYGSREQAQANPATVVYVERGLAKVTMDDFAAEYTIAAGNTYAGDKVVIKNWQLDVTNKSTFPVHQLGNLSTDYTGIWGNGRFFDGTNTTFKRVYWGIDPNYSDNTLYNGTSSPTVKTALECCEEAFSMITDNTKITGTTGAANPQYCLENTFNLANMKQGQTTRVVFKAVYTPKAFVGESVKTFYKVANNTAVWKEADLKQQIRTLALKAMKITAASEQGYYDVDLSKGTNISGVAGLHLVKKDNITFSGTGTSKVTDDVVKEINEKLGLSEDPTTHKVKVGISTYLNGEAYYIARIKHFNELTPWTAGKEYGTDNASFLGRYGVLRNNWYELSVHSISNLGYPDIPEVKPETQDDENDKYINVEVKILDWAKRSQSIDL